MATRTTDPSKDGANRARIHVPLQLAIKWEAEYTGTGIGSDDIELFPVDISLEGGSGPSGQTLGACPEMAGVPIAEIDPDTGEPVIAGVQVDAYRITFSYTKHKIPAKINYERTETDADDATNVTNGTIFIDPGLSTPSVTFSATAPTSLHQAFNCSVVFTEVIAPWL